MTRFKKIEESQTLLINNQSKILEERQKTVYKFGFGQSPFLPPKSVLQALKDHVQHKEYSSVQGELKLRQLVSRFHYRANNLQVDTENILIAPGSKILLYNIMASFVHADVFIPRPAWVSYAPQATLLDHNVIPIETDFDRRWHVTPDAIQSAFKFKKHSSSIMILNYPGNPDGLTYSLTALEAIAQKVRELNILVIADEIYGFLTFNQSHISFATLYPEKTITTTGLSKWCGAGGWRLGVAMLYADIEDDFRSALIGIGSETYSCAPTPIQYAAEAAYADFDIMHAYIKHQCAILNEIGNYCFTKLTSNGIKLHVPEGGFYLFPDFSNHTKSLKKIRINHSTELCNRLLEDTGVALLPGTAFGMPDSHLIARLAYTDFEDPLQKDNFELMRDCPKVVSGIQALCDWIARFN